MKVAILTMFNGLSSTYSLVNVVASHIQMLLANDIQVKMLVSEDCPDGERTGVFLDSRIEWVKITNRLKGRQINWRDYSAPSGRLHPSFYDEVDVISKDFVTHLSDVSVCMMHDILYQGWHYLHNMAIRKAQQSLPQLRFIAFTHSLPVNAPSVIDEKFNGRYTAMPKTIFAYPTLCGLPALAKQYNIPEGLCRQVNNTISLFDSLGEEVKMLDDKIDLLSTELLVVYPARLSTGKQFEKVAALSGAIHKATEKSIKVVFCDFPSMDTRSDAYKKEIKNIGEQFGMNADNIHFTTDLGFENGFPRKGVMDLFTLSNLFICPSFSESFGLTVLEAASRGNFIVLNQAVPALEELGKTIKAYFMRWDAKNFGFETHEEYHPSEAAYYQEHGKIIIDKMNDNPIITAKNMVRTRYSNEWVWKNQLEPLINLIN